MSGRTIIVSNRLPYGFKLPKKKKKENDTVFNYRQSSGGLVSGLKPLIENEETLWVGWADTQGLKLEDKHHNILEDELLTKGCVPVFLERKIAAGYYDGFSNSAIWPLFHYFSQFCCFDKEESNNYREVNERFCEVITEVAKPGDTIWVQDYHLMLLPQLIRENTPGVNIGFFLHIPFPSYEMFRILPNRSEILKGILGSDLIGFHTYDYTRHFLSSCRRILGVENQYGTMNYDGRLVQTDAFPLGIDYNLYSSISNSEETKKAADEYVKEKVQEDGKVMLSIERLDYSKGILDSLDAYEVFLEQNPEWIGKVVFSLIVVPSRIAVDSYQELKSQVDEKVGAIQGKYSTQSWSPVDYYYRSLPIERLCKLYKASHIMLVTPLRDGMNLVSKEYLAAHDNGTGVLILSEMAGSSYELSDAFLINPYNQEEYVSAIKKALVMPENEQKKRNIIMQKRLKQYTSQKWAESFMNTLTTGISQQGITKAKPMDKKLEAAMLKEYNKAKKRAIILDYDGTLVGFKKDPEAASPDEDLMNILTGLSEYRKNEVVIISGRDKETLDKWFGDIPIDLIAEHGIWQYRHDTENWVMNEPLDDTWKKSIRSELENFVIRTPGSFIEEKNYSLVWHCRGATEELGERRMREINKALSLEVESMGLMLLQGNKVIEIKPQGINKGRAAYSWLQEKACDFVLSAGDDTTDEDMFHAMPEDAWTIKIGVGSTEARFNVDGNEDMRQILKNLILS